MWGLIFVVNLITILICVGIYLKKNCFYIINAIYWGNITSFHSPPLISSNYPLTTSLKYDNPFQWACQTNTQKWVKKRIKKNEYKKWNQHHQITEYANFQPNQTNLKITFIWVGVANRRPKVGQDLKWSPRFIIYEYIYIFYQKPLLSKLFSIDYLLIPSNPLSRFFFYSIKFS